MNSWFYIQLTSNTSFTSNENEQRMLMNKRNERKNRYLISKPLCEWREIFRKHQSTNNIEHLRRSRQARRKKVLDNFIMSNEHCFSIYLCLMRPPIEHIRRRRDDANRHASIDIRRIVYVYLRKKKKVKATCTHTHLREKCLCFCSTYRVHREEFRLRLNHLACNDRDHDRLLQCDEYVTFVLDEQDDQSKEYWNDHLERLYSNQD